MGTKTAADCGAQSGDGVRLVVICQYGVLWCGNGCT